MANETVQYTQRKPVLLKEQTLPPVVPQSALEGAVLGLHKIYAALSRLAEVQEAQLQELRALRRAAERKARR